MTERIGKSGAANERFTPQEIEAHEYRAHKRKDSPFLEAFFRTIRSDPNLWTDIEPVIRRREDFRENTAREGELHRAGAELFAGINLNPESALLYDAALRDATEAQSDFLKSRLERGVNYAPVVVIGGGGPHASIFAGALLHYSPETPAVGIEATSRAGGIFGSTGDPAGFVQPWFQLNSRNRPENRDTLGLPGTSGNINPMGTWANLQVPDVSGQQYPTQERLGRVISHNNFNSMNLMVDAEVKKIRRNKSQDQKGAYEIEFEDPDQGKRFTVFTDIPVQATGLGRETFGIGSPSAATRRFLAREQEKFDEGIETPRLLTSLQLLERTTDNRMPFPLEEFRRGVGIIGSGDSAKVDIEYFAGVCEEANKSVAQLDFIPEIVVLGSFDQLRDNLLRSNRCRYARGFLEFQREDDTVFARVRSVKGRVVGFEETKNGVAVFYRQDNGRTISAMEVSRVVSATGFKDETTQIYELDPEEITDTQEIGARLPQALRTPGSTLYLKSAPGAPLKEITRLEVGEAEEQLVEETVADGAGRGSRLQNVLSLTIIDRAGNIKHADFLPDDQEFSPALLNQIERIVIPRQTPDFQPYIEPVFGDDIPAGERIAGENIYRIGAATKYPLPEALKAQSPTLARVPENTAALAVKEISDERAARIVAQIVRQLGGERTKEGLHMARFEREPVVFSQLGETVEETRGEIAVRAERKDADRYLPRDIRAESVLRYEVAARLSGEFPPNISVLNFTVQKIETGEVREVEYQIALDPPVPSSGGWERIDAFFQNALVQRALGRLSGLYKNGAVAIAIPVKEGKIDIANVSVRALDRRAAAEIKKEGKR